MGSKFGFDKMAAATPRIMKEAMQEIAKASKDHFVENFDKQSFGNNPWAALIRKEPPDKLNVTGRLKKATADSIQKVTDKEAVLENKAVDDRGNRYSNYHNEGTPLMPARPIMKQDDELTKKQLNILESKTSKIWKLI